MPAARGRVVRVAGPLPLDATPAAGPPGAGVSWNFSKIPAAENKRTSARTSRKKNKKQAGFSAPLAEPLLLPARSRPRACLERFEALWAAECLGGKRPTMKRALFLTTRRELAFSTAFQCLRIVFQIAQAPVLLGSEGSDCTAQRARREVVMVQLFLRNFQTREAEWYVYPVLVFACSLGEITATSQSAHWMQRPGAGEFS